jgi:hypothetical protein
VVEESFAVAGAVASDAGAGVDSVAAGACAEVSVAAGVAALSWANAIVGIDAAHSANAKTPMHQIPPVRILYVLMLPTNPDDRSAAKNLGARRRGWRVNDLFLFSAV